MENNSVPAAPGPRPAAQAPAPISRARAAVLERLRSQAGPLAVEDLAAAAGQHPNTVREHLEALVASGQAAKSAAPSRGRGRPAWRYTATAPHREGYPALAAALAGQLARQCTDPAGAGVAAGLAWAQSLPVPAPEPDAAGGRPGAVRQVVRALAAAGFGIGPDTADGPGGGAVRTVVRLTACPLLDAAREHPQVVCSVHLGLVRGLLARAGSGGGDVRLEPFAEPGACLLSFPAGPADGTA